MSGRRQLWNKQHTHEDPHKRYRCHSRHHLQIHHVQAIHQSLGDATHKSNDRQHLRTGSGHWHRTHISIKKTYQHCHKTYHLGQNLSELTPSQSSSHYIPSGAWEMQSQTALSKSLTLSPVHIMTISVINSMTGCRLYDLSKPLLMRM